MHISKWTVIYENQIIFNVKSLKKKKNYDKNAYTFLSAKAACLFNRYVDVVTLGIWYFFHIIERNLFSKTII